MTAHVLRHPQGCPMQEPGTADREQVLAQEQMAPQALVQASPATNSHVGGPAREVHECLRARHAHLDVGVLPTEALEPRDEPARAERRRHAHGERTADATPPHTIDARGDPPERVCDGRQERLSRRGEREGAIRTTEQDGAERGLQHLHLLAHGAGRDVQLPGSQREAPVACGCLEDTQPVQGWQRRDAARPRISPTHSRVQKYSVVPQCSNALRMPA